METRIGTKIVKVLPMSRADYNAYRGWQLPANENGADSGYLVEYLDGGQPNDSRHAGYISWSPAAQCDAAYVALAHLDALAYGERVAEIITAYRAGAPC